VRRGARPPPRRAASSARFAPCETGPAARSATGATVAARDRLLSPRPVHNRSDRQQALPWPVPERVARIGARHRSSISSREIREELIRRGVTRAMAPNTRARLLLSTYRLRSASAEIGKALDCRSAKSSWSPNWRTVGPEGLLTSWNIFLVLPGAKDAPLWKELCQLAQESRGLPRLVSQHPGGMIISSRPLIEDRALEGAAMEDRVVCQWTRTLAPLLKNRFPRAGHVVARRGMRRADRAPPRGRAATRPLAHRLRDPAIYDRICAGDTIGLFPDRERAQIQMIRRSRPRNLEDLAVEVAIVRPGPIVGGAVNPYVRRRESSAARTARQAVRAAGRPIPCSANVSRKRWAVILYQIRCCKSPELAGFTTGQAEALRPR